MNKVILCGRMTDKPVLRYTGNNIPYARFTLAVNKPRVKDKEPEADFINCIAWHKTGEIIAEYFDKGSQIVVNGRIQNNSYQDKDGNKRYTTDIVIDEFDFVGAKKEKSVSNEEQKAQETSDPFAEFGETVSIEDNFLD